MIRQLKFLAAIAILLISFSPAFSQTSKKDLTLEDIFQNGVFASKPVAGFVPLNDGKSFCRQENGKLKKYSFETGEETGILLDEKDLVPEGSSAAIKMETFSFSQDESKILIKTGMESIYRHSSRELVYIWDTKSKKLHRVSADKIMNASLSPDAKSVGYVKNNDLYVKHLEQDAEIRITSDGKKNSIINGAPDWVYEEEFGFSQGLYWSPDSRFIAFYRFDESNVPEFSMDIYGKLYPEKDTFKYPKAGEANSIVTIHTYDLDAKKTTRMETGTETDQYIPRIKWTATPGMLCITRLNRLQNELDLLLVNAATGSASVIYNEKNKYYVDINDNLTFLKNGTQYIWTSEQDGYNHIYLHSLDGKTRKQLTKGKWEVSEFHGVDEKNKLVYFTSTEVSPMERHLYSVKLNGDGKKKLTDSTGVHYITFNNNHSFYMDVFSSINSPSYSRMHRANGKHLRTLEDNAALRDRLANYDISRAEFSTLKTSQGTELNYWMIKPKDFNPAKKYPVLMFVYGGPGNQQVMNQWGIGNYSYHQYLATKGYLIVCVDNRGTGGRGEEFKKMTYLQLGKYEVEDQIEAAKYLGTLPYVDKNRIGIWGWSYGGYMSSLCITKGADYFKTAIAVAPVTNWKYYDNIYTERFMRTPKENNAGYDDNSPINHVDKLKGKYLIIHGTADDNVHFQNTVEMVNSMIKLNKPFDSEFYPNKAHGISGGKTRIHLFSRISEYILNNL
jgi:dipeptidyl-peptidase-4